ncbi:50S ribosomal protein L31 [bacterium]|nr:50S ribosomal protein L31 [bacterium]
MKSKTHPKLHATTVSCTCGNKFETLATVENLRVEICSKCHPFYTGKQRNIASEGQVEKFNRRYGKSKNQK